MASVSKFSIRFQSKSISLPCRSHPITLEIEELISKIKTTLEKETSADAICSGLSQLTRLYKCMDDILTSSTTKLMMSHEQNKRWVDSFIDESVKCLDICGSISDMLSEIKGHTRDVLCALRRRKGELSFENDVMKYICIRKKMRKDVRGLIGSMKQVDNMINSTGAGGGSVVVSSDSDHLAAVIRAVIGVSEMSNLVFESLLRFFCVPVSKPNRWSIVVSKFMHKGIVSCEYHQENETGNEFERTDAALKMLCKYRISSEMGNVKSAQCRLERLRAQIESMEGGLECVFKCLVRIRVSFLNIISL